MNIVLSEIEAAKTRVRRTCAAFDDAGSDFERLTGEVLVEFGFFNVRRQTAGQQFGKDFTADLDDAEGGTPTRWYFECKNLAVPVGAGHAAPKLIWHLSAQGLTGGFVVVAPSRLSNELHELLQRTDFPFSVFNWTDDNFIQLIALCPNVLRKWFPDVSLAVTPAEAAIRRSHLLRPATAGYEMSNPLQMSVSPRFDPPFEYAYYQRDGRFEKWPSDVAFMHWLTLFNVCRWPLIVRAVKVRTLNYEPLERRILGEVKAKGIVPPLRLKYTPVLMGGRDVDLLGSNTLRLNHRETETILLELTSKAEPGCYELQIVVEYDGNGTSRTVEGPRMRVCVCARVLDDAAADPSNRLRLFVWRKHYDLLARRVLGLSPVDWAHINAARQEDALLCLGPTMFDDLERRPTGWTIQSLPLGKSEGQPDGSYARSFVDNAELILDLGDVPDEVAPPEPFSDVERMSKLYGVPVGQLFGPSSASPDGHEPRRNAPDPEDQS